MSKMLDRVEALEEILRVEAREEILPPRSECSPWFPAAADSLTDEERRDVLRYMEGAMAAETTGREVEATPAQWKAYGKLCRKEAQLKEEAVRRGEKVRNISVLWDTWDEPSKRRSMAEDER